MRTLSIVSATLASSALCVAALVAACGGSNGQTGFGPNGNGNGGNGNGNGNGGNGNGNGGSDAGIILTPGGDGGSGPVTSSCPGGGSTTISGTVYDPAGKNPLYNVVVYVPGSTPGPLKTGASCDSCDSLYTGNPITTTLTDTSGKFTLQNAPAGNNVPLVIQIGKWRKQVKVPTVASCTDNPVSGKLTLPKNGSEGDIPAIAVSTGGADSLECLLERIGLDASEYTGGAAGTGHIHIFEGGAGPQGLTPPTMSPAASSSAALWDSTADLMNYDIVLLSCEGQETSSPNRANLEAYTRAGGRVFSSHFHYAWLNSGPFGADNLATWTAGATPITANPPSFPDLLASDGEIDETLADGGVFPKGKALKAWLGTVNALGSNGYLPIDQAKHNADIGPQNVYSQKWIHAAPDTDTAGATEYFSFNTPVDAKLDDAGLPEYCGRVVYSDLHVGAGSGLNQDYGGIGGGQGTVPTGCVSRDLSPQEQALEFMLFDLSSCVVSDSQPPQPPPSNPPK